MVSGTSNDLHGLFNVLRDHPAFGLLHEKSRSRLHIGWQNSRSPEKELAAADPVSGAGRDGTRLLVPFRDRIDCLDGNIAHQQIDPDIGEQGELRFKQVRAPLDGCGGDSITGLAALDCHGEIHTQIENILQLVTFSQASWNASRVVRAKRAFSPA